MIKLFRFVNRSEGVSAEQFASAWPAAVARAHRAPGPLRIAACTVLPEGKAGLDGISIAWFTDARALHAFTTMEEELDPGLVSASERLVAEERVMRGADWLAQHWSGPEPKLKHMALARRAEGLSAAAFAERWRTHAGTVGPRALAIPDAAKGLAYVQNYPLDEQRRRYDAVNEVYFDERAALQSRLDFFREQDVGRAQADLVAEATFAVVRETVV